MDCTLTAGTPLREVTIAAEFNVSRRTVQDALALLSAEGLVRHERHRGSRVAQLTRADVNDLYAVRLGLELLAARHAPQASEAARERLRAACEDLRVATSTRRASEMVRRDLDFHRAVVGLLESPRIDRFFGTIASEMRYALSLLESVSQDAATRPQEAFEEHVEILGPLLAGDVTSSERLITQHVAIYRDRLAESIRSDDA